MPASLANHLFHVRGVALGATLAGARVASDKAQAHGTAPRAPKDQDNTACPHFPHCACPGGTARPKCPAREVTA